MQISEILVDGNIRFSPLDSNISFHDDLIAQLIRLPLLESPLLMKLSFSLMKVDFGELLSVSLSFDLM